MEYMDAGSLDKLEQDGIPEPVLGRITGSMVRGLKFLKDDMQIIHRGTYDWFMRPEMSSSPCRRKADERPCEQEGRGEAVRLRCFGPARTVARED